MANREQDSVVILMSVVQQLVQQDGEENETIFQELLQPFFAVHGNMELNREGPRQFSGVQEYIERTVTGYSDPYFKKHFRMSRESFEHLIRMMATYLNTNDSGVPVQTKLLVTLWTLANIESFRGIGDRFGMYMGNVHYIFLCTTRAFRLNSIEFIKWPTMAEYTSITQRFSFPYAIGSIDSTFIRIRQPLKQCHVYTNRKKFCAVTLQAVSKPNLEFIDISTGYPSSMHDASVFANSQLGRNLPTLLHGTPFLLLGDSAYGLTTTLMKPYPDNGRLDENSSSCLWLPMCRFLPIWNFSWMITLTIRSN
ncbi:hypothetical protein GHT06_012780 [Daphnia sinensis]|uniref:DDE Tnp4 domain-containing protein n=1 Tax=Daphnia sinensis TaxID=1820382 RepID=A0AAD5KY88_9CRUS|nr:hypothetical protein GHT06_012780 [Daphnia sinensis]